MALFELCYTPIRRQGVPDALNGAAAPFERREAFRWYEHAISHGREGRRHLSDAASALRYSRRTRDAAVRVSSLALEV